MPDESEHAAAEDVSRALGRFDPRWFPVALRSAPGRDRHRSGRASAGPVVAARLEELLVFYRGERTRIQRYARTVLGGALDDDGSAAEDLVLRALRRLCQDPPAFPGGPGPSVRAAIRAESAATDDQEKG